MPDTLKKSREIGGAYIIKHQGVDGMATILEKIPKHANVIMTEMVYLGT